MSHSDPSHNNLPDKDLGQGNSPVCTPVCYDSPETVNKARLADLAEALRCLTDDERAMLGELLRETDSESE